MKSLKVYLSESHDPHLNLAAEHQLFSRMNPEDPMLLIWRNEPSVVIGRYQNPWYECDLKAMKHQGVQLARRQSGGGAVYHDLGNTNFTFFSSRRSYSKEKNTRIVIDALSRFGIEAEASGRNDIAVDGRKVSGSAFKLSSDRAYHHGTLLISADIPSLLRYLTPENKKFTAKGVRSVASRVANLSEFSPLITHQSVSEALIEAFSSAYRSSCEVIRLDASSLEQDQDLMPCFQMMGDWEWLYGKTPEFVHPLAGSFSWGEVTGEITCLKGRIAEAVLRPQPPVPGLQEGTAEVLRDVQYGSDEVLECREQISRKCSHYRLIRDILAWIASEI